MKSLILITGGFDPLHSGHIEYIKAAKKLSEYLVVGLNSDDWLIRKKKYFLLPFKERASVISNLNGVDEVISFDDSDDSAIDAIQQCLKISESVTFANGGDRKKDNIPEITKFLNHEYVNFVFGVGGNNKANSSSWLVSEFIAKYLKGFSESNEIDLITIDAPWGSHSCFLSEEGYKVKILRVKPGGILSLQKHEFRSEYWVVGKGQATVEIDGHKKIVKSGEYTHIPLQSIHRLSNECSEDLEVIEVQCGTILEESDITRFEDQYGRNS